MSFVSKTEKVAQTVVVDQIQCDDCKELVKGYNPPDDWFILVNSKDAYDVSPFSHKQKRIRHFCPDCAGLI